MQLSIIIPAFNEEANIVATLAPLQPMRARRVEVIVVDGGSTDRTREAALALCDHVLSAPTGRALQMNSGATIAKGEVLLFLHADSQLPADADRLITESITVFGRIWGRFDVSIAGQHFFLPVVAWFMNWRSWLTSIATGDQGLFMRTDIFKRLGGFPSIPLMEDVAMTTRLKQLGPPVCLGERILTSGRRWETHGVWRTILLMWRLRLAYFFGADPHALHRAYYGKRC